MLLFVGIWIWAWHKRHKPTFDYMAKLPMEDEDLPAATPANARETRR
jgi:cbb3-type cytochrome oxidase subunit 3